MVSKRKPVTVWAEKRRQGSDRVGKSKGKSSGPVAEKRRQDSGTMGREAKARQRHDGQRRAMILQTQRRETGGGHWQCQAEEGMQFVAMAGVAKSDFAVMAVHPELSRLQRLTQQIAATELGTCLQTVYSFLSMSEISEYMSGPSDWATPSPKIDGTFAWPSRATKPAPSPSPPTAKTRRIDWKNGRPRSAPNESMEACQEIMPVEPGHIFLTVTY